MSEASVYNFLLWLSFALAAAVFTALFFINAPYGRHLRQGWGLTLPARLGWLVMESSSVLVFALTFWLGREKWSLAGFIFFGMWQAHYLYRAFIYPFRIAGGRKRMPLVIVLLAIGFNSGNAYLNGRYLFSLSGGYPTGWLLDPRFMVGLALFAVGYALHLLSDRTLRELRGAGELGYKIPDGGLFRWVSCPNYLGEIIEWAGWALATWSLAGLSFAAWTFANLAPRARANHIWYRAHFPDYPAERKALIPGFW